MHPRDSALLGEIRSGLSCSRQFKQDLTKVAGYYATIFRYSLRHLKDLEAAETPVDFVLTVSGKI